MSVAFLILDGWSSRREEVAQIFIHRSSLLSCAWQAGGQQGWAPAGAGSAELCSRRWCCLGHPIAAVAVGPVMFCRASFGGASSLLSSQLLMNLPVLSKSECIQH